MLIGVDFDGFRVDFWYPNEAKNYRKSTNKSFQQHNNGKIKMFKNHWFLQYNRALGYVILCTTFNKN